MNSKYRYPVFPVTSCPLNSFDWKSSARRRNCSLDDVRNRYLCVPDQRRSVLLEFCYDEVRPMVQEGNCIELAGSGTLNQYNCIDFKAGVCPEEPYFSDLVYTHPACLEINTDDRCYFADPKCPNKTLDFPGIQPNLTSIPTSNNNGQDKAWMGGVVAGSVCFILLIFLLIFFLLRRNNMTFKRNRESKDLRKSLLQLEEGHDESDNEHIEIEEPKAGTIPTCSLTAGGHDELNFEHIETEEPKTVAISTCSLPPRVCNPAKEKSLFYEETRQFKDVKDAVEKNKCVLIIGDSGCGKTATMKQVAYCLAEEDFVIKKISAFKDIKLDSDVDSKVVFLWDNAFGMFGFDISFVQDLESYRDLNTLLKSKYSKLILTCRTAVYEKIKKFNFSLVATIVDLSDIVISLDIQEKTGLLNHVCGHYKVAEVDKLTGSKSQAFPLLCMLLSDFKELRLKSLEFFDNHQMVFLKYLDSIREERQVSYLFLVYCVLKGSFSYPFDNSDDSSERIRIEADSCHEYCRNGFSIKDIDEECDRLVQETQWFLRDGKHYIFKHTYVFEMLAFHYGKDHTNRLLKYMECNFISEKCLINEEIEASCHEEKLCVLVKRESLKERIFTDIKDLKYLEAFTNKCWNDELFCRMCCTSIQQMELSDFEITFLSLKPIDHRDYRIERSDKKAKRYLSLKSNDCEWFREKLLEGRTENVIEDNIYYEGNVKAVSWVIGYGISSLLKDIVSKAKHSRYWIEQSSSDDVEQIRLLLLAIFSEDYKCFEIIVRCLDIQTINTTCFSCTNIEDEESDCLNKHKKFTPLTASCYMGFTSAMRKLVEMGANVNLKDENESTPLVLACRFGVSSDVEYLIEKGASLHLGSPQFPLIAAVMGKNVKTVEFLLQNNVNVNKSNEKEKTALYYAAKLGSLDIVKLLVEHGAQVNKTDEDRKSPLYWVAQKGHYDIADFLIDHGAECDQSDSKNKSPLYCAAKRGYLKIIKLLVKKGADINRPTTKNRTALYRAAKRGYFEICKYLIDNSANVNKTDKKGYSPLYWASKKGHETIVELLLANNAFVDSQSDGGKTALYWASQKGRLDIATCLINRGAEVNLTDKDNKSPLYCASKRGHTEMVEYLISSGAVVNTSTKNSKSAVFRAAKRNHVCVLKLLLAKGADINLSNKQNESPLYWAARRGHHEVVHSLLSAKTESDVNMSCELQQTALYWACQKGYLNIVISLVNHGAFVNQADRRCKSPLYCAAKRGFYEIVKFLIENGADVNTRNMKNQSALYRASKRNHETIVKYLIDKKADLNVQDKYGDTPLHWAATNGHIEIVKLLCKNESDINVSNKKKQTPIHCAERSGHIEIFNYLSGLDADPQLPVKYAHPALDMFEEAELDNAELPIEA